jgi:hypothetical protein
MAKQKRSVALFEVINKDKRFDRRGGALPTPAWWYKGKLAPPPPAPSAPQQPQPLLARPIAPTSSLSEAVLGGATSPELTRTSAAIIGAAVVLVLGIGILWTRSHRAAASPGVEAILRGPAHPGVLDIAPARSAAVQASDDNELPALAAHAGSVQTPARVPNQNYVVIRVYLTQVSATETRDMLIRNDIPCTIERGLAGVAPGFAIIGLTPISAIGTPQYNAYVQQIKTALTPHTVHAYLIKWPQPGQTG